MLNLLTFEQALSTVISVLLAIVMLLFMITVHELGHYVAGKIFKFKINEFAIGMGPALFKRKNKKTGELFSIRALPLGGFCAFEGEDQEVESADAFNNKEPWKRIIVLISGALMNFITGFLVLCLSIGIYGQLVFTASEIKVDLSPEYSGYSLETGDTILKIDGKNIYMSSDISSIISGKKKGEVVSVEVLNSSGEKVSRKVRLHNDVDAKNLSDVIPSFTALGISTLEYVEGVYENSQLVVGDYLLRFNDGAEYQNCSRIYSKQQLIDYYKSLSVGESCSFYVGKGASENRLITVLGSENAIEMTNEQVSEILGISKSSLKINAYTKNHKFSFFESIGRGFEYSFIVAGTIFRTLGELLTGKLGISMVGGPITTISMTSNIIKTGGFNYFLEMAGFIGINLAVFNLLPIPALDGSRVVFCIIEWIRKKPVNRKVEGIIHGVGLAVLLAFSVLVDLLQLF